MFSYKITCTNINKTELKDAEMIESRMDDKVAYHRFCENKEDEDIFLFVVEDRIDKFVFDVISNKSFDKIHLVDDAIKDFITAMGKKFDNIKKKEIGIDTLKTDMIESKYFGASKYSIKRKYKFDFLDEFNDCFKEFMIDEKPISYEELINNNTDNYVLTDDLHEELKRIYTPRKFKSFGIPVHYIFNMKENTGRDAIKLLANALHSNGRMLREKYTILNLSQIRGAYYDITEQINSLLKSNDGGVVVMLLDSEFDFSKDYFNKMLKEIYQNCISLNNEITYIFHCCSLNEKEINCIKNDLSNFSFIEINEPSLLNENAKNFLTETAIKYKYDSEEIDSLLNLVETNKSYNVDELIKIFNNWRKKYVINGQFPQYSMFTNKKDEIADMDISCHNGYKELNSLIGLDSVKKIVTDIINFSKVQQACMKNGEKNIQFSKHMCFIGNPGTAKTTVARIIAKIMKEEGLLENGKLIEVGRADLVSQYVGGTAAKVKKIFQQAVGNVLFIDEAYSLCDKNDGMYGDEAISTIVQEMENNRGNMIVIFAGYKKEMDRFLNKNSGLKSRIAFEIEFPDYSEDDLLKIADYYAKQIDVDISHCKEKIKEIIACKKGDKNFGNGRFVRSLIERSRIKQSSRIINENLLNTPKMKEILPEDIDVVDSGAKRFSIGFSD